MKNQRISHVLTNIYNYIPFNNVINVGAKNSLICHGILKQTKIRVSGENNKIIIGEWSRIINSNIEIKGNNNIIMIGDESLITEGEFFIEDDLGTIKIGRDTKVCGKTHFACIEGSGIIVGDDCLFSANITIRTGDSHSIVDFKTRQRLNPSKCVVIGDHVWIGNQVTILKGVTIPEHTIIGTGSIVTKSCEQRNAIIVGNPAKVVKTSVDWFGQRI